MIGIMTFHRANNYGAVLQCYALQRALNDEGIRNQVIDYRCRYIEKHYSPMPSVSFKHTKRFCLDLLQVPNKIKTRKRFKSFLNKYISMSTPMLKEELRTKTKNYKTIIVGSDQVWNKLSSNGDKSYLLDFASKNTTKISYAASVGIEEWQTTEKEDMRKSLEGFTSISVREPKSVEMIKEVYGGDVHVNVDPTVLLKVSEWEKITNESKLKKRDFIFVYIMQPSDNLYLVAKELSKNENLEIISISTTERKCKIGKNAKGAAVSDFLWYIKNAKYVVTNSFHGMMFSMIFQKEFFWDYQKGSNMSNMRFDMLVEQYGIRSRCYDKNKAINDYSDLNYELIKKTMKQQRMEGLNYLIQNTKGDNGGK